MKKFDVEKLNGTGRIQFEAKDLRHAKEKAASEIYEHAKVRYSAGTWHEYGQTLSLVEKEDSPELGTWRSPLHDYRPRIRPDESKDLEQIQDQLEGKFDRKDAFFVLESLRKDRQDVFRCLADVLRDSEDGKIKSSKYGAFMGLMKAHKEGLEDFFQIA